MIRYDDSSFLSGRKLETLLTLFGSKFGSMYYLNYIISINYAKSIHSYRWFLKNWIIGKFSRHCRKKLANISLLDYYGSKVHNFFQFVFLRKVMQGYWIFSALNLNDFHQSKTHRNNLLFAFKVHEIWSCWKFSNKFERIRKPSALGEVKNLKPHSPSRTIINRVIACGNVLVYWDYDVHSLKIVAFDNHQSCDSLWKCVSLLGLRWL